MTPERYVQEKAISCSKMLFSLVKVMKANIAVSQFMVNIGDIANCKDFLSEPKGLVSCVIEEPFVSQLLEHRALYAN